MSAAGVRVGPRLLWVDPGGATLRPGDRVAVALHGEELQGTVHVAPSQLVAGDVDVGGTVLRVLPSASVEDDETEIPLAGLPPLGSTVHCGRGSGRVIGLDPPKGTVTVALDGVLTVELPASDVTEDEA